MQKHFSKEKEKARFETFIDAILAIIITILVLEFKVPENAYDSDDQIKALIHHIGPSVLSYVISFASIVSLWIDHHDLCRNIQNADIRFVILNFIFILFLSPIPFTTALAGRNHESSFAVMLVASNYFLMNVSFGSIWAYVVAKKIIPDTITNTRHFKRSKNISMAASVLLLMSIPLAYVNTYLTFSLFIIVLVLHFGKEFYRKP